MIAFVRKNLYKYRYAIIVLLIAIWSSLPSLLIYSTLLETEPGQIPYFYNSTVQFDEKFWIYLLEFKRQEVLGLFSWPSISAGFESIVYLERIFPRLIYSFASVNSFFLMDTILISIGMIGLYMVLVKSMNRYAIQRLAIIAVLAGISIYDTRIFFIESIPVEAWWSRNIVASLSLLFFTYIVFSKKNKSVERGFLALSIVCLSLTHTYAFLFCLSTVGLIALYDMFIHKKQPEMVLVLSFLAALLIKIWSVINMSSSSDFENFQVFYGLMPTSEVNYYEFVKYVILGVFGIICAPSRRAKLILVAMIVSGLVLTNQQIITGSSLRDIHYRLYIFEWIVSIYIVQKILNYKLFSNVSEIVKLSIIGVKLTIFISLYTFLFRSENIDSIASLSNDPPLIDMPLSTFIVTKSSSDLVAFDKFIWDAPEVKDIKSMLIDSSLGKDETIQWQRATLHLHRLQNE